MLLPAIIIGVGGQGATIALEVKRRLTDLAGEHDGSNVDWPRLEQYTRLFAIDTTPEAGILANFPAGASGEGSARLSNLVQHASAAVRPPGTAACKPIVFASAGVASLEYPVRSIHPLSWLPAPRPRAG